MGINGVTIREDRSFGFVVANDICRLVQIPKTSKVHPSAKDISFVFLFGVFSLVYF